MVKCSGQPGSATGIQGQVRIQVKMMKFLFVRLFRLSFLCFLLFHPLGVWGSSFGEYRHGWPALKPPRGVIVCPSPSAREEAMLLESLSGLAAQAVNEGRFDRMVWIDTDKPSYRRIFEKSLEAMAIESRERMDVWTLLARLKEEGIVKGYVLYSGEKSRGKRIADYSANVATVYASLLSGVLVDTSLEAEARRFGLEKLKDAREESPAECFRKNKANLNNVSALSIHPAVSNMRDYAIAHRLMLYADEKELANEVLEWVRPLSPVLGWSVGDEYEATSLISEWGHYNTASDWCVNLPLITAAAPFVPLEKAREIPLAEIDFADSSYLHAFVMSDGDNMQWMMGSFIDNPAYLGNRRAQKTAISWTSCPVNLSVVSPVSWNELVRRQGDRNSYIEYGGGYQYPDLFAVRRPNREALLREFARRVGERMKELDVKIFGAIFRNLESEEAQEALRIYAEEMDGLTGMIAVQYFPYELGRRIYWYKNGRGTDIPLITANFALWNEVRSDRPFCGVPEYVASLVNRDARTVSFEEGYSCTVVHAWSDFGQTSEATPAPAVGLNPVLATESLLQDGIRTVSLNELLWRVRMRYRPEQTEALLRSERQTLP